MTRTQHAAASSGGAFKPAVQLRAVLRGHQKVVFRRQKRTTFDVKISTYFTFYVGHSTRQGISLLFFQTKKIRRRKVAKLSTHARVSGHQRHVPARAKSVQCVCVCVFFPFILDIKFVGRTSRGHTGGRSHRISHPPSFCGACLNFSPEKDSAFPFRRRP